MVLSQAGVDETEVMWSALCVAGGWSHRIPVLSWYFSLLLPLKTSAWLSSIRHGSGAPCRLMAPVGADHPRALTQVTFCAMKRRFVGSPRPAVSRWRESTRSCSSPQALLATLS